MTSNEIMRSDLLDILFDNRNKQYGAYTLRREYNRRLSLALLLSLGLIMIFCIFLNSADNNQTIINPFQGKELVVGKVIPPEIKKPELPPAKKVQPAVAQEKLTRIDIRKDKEVQEVVPDQSDLEHARVSTVQASGEDFEGVPVPKENLPSGIATPVPVESKPAPLPQRDPEFPGGVEAWRKYLSRNLMVPDELEAGQKKTVMIRFEVATDGMVTGFQVVRSGGSQYDAEVIRVLKRMPKWKPAIKDGVAVATTFTQPVTFVGEEQ